jgi:hypothetical protein
MLNIFLKRSKTVFYLIELRTVNPSKDLEEAIEER